MSKFNSAGQMRVREREKEKEKENLRKRKGSNKGRTHRNMSSSHSRGEELPLAELQSQLEAVASVAEDFASWLEATYISRGHRELLRSHIESFSNSDELLPLYDKLSRGHSRKRSRNPPTSPRGSPKVRHAASSPSPPSSSPSPSLPLASSAPVFGSATSSPSSPSSSSSSHPVLVKTKAVANLEKRLSIPLSARESATSSVGSTSTPPSPTNYPPPSPSGPQPATRSSSSPELPILPNVPSPAPSPSPSPVLGRSVSPKQKRELKPKNVVIIGGGWSGSFIYSYIVQEWENKPYHVTLVDVTGTLEDTPSHFGSLANGGEVSTSASNLTSDSSSLTEEATGGGGGGGGSTSGGRANSSPKSSGKSTNGRKRIQPFVTLSDLLAGGTCISDEVVNVSPTQVKLLSGKTLPYDYLCICSGAAVSPGIVARRPYTTKQSTKAFLKRYNAIREDPITYVKFCVAARENGVHQSVEFLSLMERWIRAIGDREALVVASDSDSSTHSHSRSRRKEGNSFLHSSDPEEVAMGNVITKRIEKLDDSLYKQLCFIVKYFITVGSELSLKISKSLRAPILRAHTDRDIATAHPLLLSLRDDLALSLTGFLSQFMNETLGKNRFRPYAYTSVSSLAEARALQNATKVAVVGSGPLASMLAGELSLQQDKWEVSLHLQGSEYLTGYPREVANISLNTLSARGVKVVRDASIQTLTLGGTPVMITKDMEKKRYSRAYLCESVSPNTSFMKKDFARFLTASGQIEVSTTLQMSHQENIFVLGKANSLTSLSEEYTLAQSLEQAVLVARNLVRMSRGKELRCFTRTAAMGISLDCSSELVLDPADSEWKLLKRSERHSIEYRLREYVREARENWSLPRSYYSRRAIRGLLAEDLAHLSRLEDGLTPRRGGSERGEDEVNEEGVATGSRSRAASPRYGKGDKGSRDSLSTSSPITFSKLQKMRNLSKRKTSFSPNKSTLPVDDLIDTNVKFLMRKQTEDSSSEEESPAVISVEKAGSKSFASMLKQSTEKMKRVVTGQSRKAFVDLLRRDGEESNPSPSPNTMEPVTPTVLGTYDLVRIVVERGRKDESFIAHFIFAHEHFVESADVVDQLVELAKLSDSGTLSFIGKVLVRWMRMNPKHFLAVDSGVSELFEDFLVFLKGISSPMHLFLRHALIQTRNSAGTLRTSSSNNSGNNQGSDDASFELPPPILHLSSTELSRTDSSLLLYHPEEIARQLTLLEHRRLLSIDLSELVRERWTHSDNRSPTLNRVAKALDKLTNWFAFQVIQEEDLSHRVRVLAHLIDVGIHLLQARNFNTLLGVFLSLYFPSISRLKSTWESLSESSRTKWARIQYVMSPFGNFANYRELVAQLDRPTIMCQEVFLKDILYYSSKREMEPSQIDVDQMVGVGVMIASVYKTQTHLYNYRAFGKLIEFLSSITTMSPAELDARSEQLQLLESEPLSSRVGGVDTTPPKETKETRKKKSHSRTSSRNSARSGNTNVILHFTPISSPNVDAQGDELVALSRKNIIQQSPLVFYDSESSEEAKKAASTPRSTPRTTAKSSSPATVEKEQPKRHSGSYRSRKRLTGERAKGIESANGVVVEDGDNAEEETGLEEAAVDAGDIADSHFIHRLKTHNPSPLANSSKLQKGKQSYRRKHKSRRDDPS